MLTPVNCMFYYTVKGDILGDEGVGEEDEEWGKRWDEREGWGNKGVEGGGMKGLGEMKLDTGAFGRIFLIRFIQNENDAHRSISIGEDGRKLRGDGGGERKNSIDSTATGTSKP